MYGHLGRGTGGAHINTKYSPQMESMFQTGFLLLIKYTLWFVSIISVFKIPVDGSHLYSLALKRLMQENCHEFETFWAID